VKKNSYAAFSSEKEIKDELVRRLWEWSVEHGKEAPAEIAEEMMDEAADAVHALTHVLSHTLREPNADAADDDVADAECAADDEGAESSETEDALDID
jgi:hypothetical protein